MQATKIRAYADLHDLDLVTIEQDAGLSGRSVSGRPAIQNVLEMVQGRTVQHVLVFKLDRLARNCREALEIADLLQQRNVSLHSLSESLDTGSASGKLFFTLIAGMAEWERQTIAERTKQALNRKREKGERVGGRPRYGWQIINREMVQEPSEQEAIFRMKELLVKGYSTREIVRQLVMDGIRTRAGGHFTQTQVVRILRAA
jgi:site-specific DNA recombinase